MAKNGARGLGRQSMISGRFQVANRFAKGWSMRPDFPHRFMGHKSPRGSFSATKEK